MWILVAAALGIFVVWIILAVIAAAVCGVRVGLMFQTAANTITRTKQGDQS